MIKSHIAVIRDKAGPKGQLQGTVAFDPEGVDEVFRRKYGSICSGNSNDHAKLVEQYSAEYGEYVYRCKEAVMGAITPEDLMHAAGYGTEAASGPDQLRPEYFTLWSSEAFRCLADMINKVECGAGWRKQAMRTMVAFMAKDVGNDRDPLAYRVLLMMLVAYLLWARKSFLVRAAELQPMLRTVLPFASSSSSCLA